MTKELKRVTIKVSEDVYEYFKKRADHTGVAMSSLMFLALEEKMLQEILIPHVPEILQRVEQDQSARRSREL